MRLSSTRCGDEIPLLSAIQERELEVTGTFRDADTWPASASEANQDYLRELTAIPVLYGEGVV